MVLTKEKRTRAIIEYFRGLPGEYMMLKGILCMNHPMDDTIKAELGDCADLWEAQMEERNSFNDKYDTIMIAERMDQIG